MYALLVSAALLGQANDDWFESWRDRRQRERDAAAQRDNDTRIAATGQQEDRTNTYIIAGAVVAGLVLLGLIARGGRKG